MASQNTSSSSEQQQNMQGQIIDQKKRKRMQSNRESARRSRMRKQKHLDDLTAQIAQLTSDNTQIMTSISVTTQSYMNVEAENSVLRAQMVELTQRLNSLNEILNYMNNASSSSSSCNNNNNYGISSSSCVFEADHHHQGFHQNIPHGIVNGGNNDCNSPWDLVGFNHQQAIVASSAMMFDY